MSKPHKHSGPGIAATNASTTRLDRYRRPRTMIIHEYDQDLNPCKVYLAEYELELIDADEIWYWYEYGNYEGSGQMIARKGNMFLHHDMSHCSCFGPTDNFPDDYQPINHLENNLRGNSGYWKEIEPLFNLVTHLLK